MTSSASVPDLMAETKMRKNGLLHEGQTIVCTGFRRRNLLMALLCLKV